MRAVRLLVLALAACLILIAAPRAQAPAGRAAVEGQFRQWLSDTVWPDAQRQGVSRATFDRAVASLSLDWTLPELQPPGQAGSSGEQRQAEFQSPGRYFVESQLAGLARTGAGLAQSLKPTLDAIERRYGVPREIVVAVWGRESHFGRVAAQRPAVRVLATQAFMGRRKALYYPELIAALQILEEDHLEGAAMLSSWAGAMGQPQLLPSKFLLYAADGDGDGRRDIWRSSADSLASIANYLRAHGWKPDRIWGVEVRLPAEVSCTLEGPKQGRPMREWARLGIAPAAGGALPESGGETGFLVMPAGRFGPAFLVSENFYVLKQYNESDVYALFIGQVADRMAGGGPIRGTFAPLAGLRRSDVLAMQRRLSADGYDVGRQDGLVGFATRTAIGQWQAKARREETCFPDAALVQAIR